MGSTKCDWSRKVAKSWQKESKATERVFGSDNDDEETGGGVVVFVSVVVVELVDEDVVVASMCLLWFEKKCAFKKIKIRKKTMSHDDAPSISSTPAMIYLVDIPNTSKLSFESVFKGVDDDTKGKTNSFFEQCSKAQQL